MKYYCVFYDKYNNFLDMDYVHDLSPAEREEYGFKTLAEHEAAYFKIELR